MSDELRVRKLTPEEIEKALADRFGDKLAPVDPAKVAKRRKQQEIYGQRRSS